MEFTQQELQKDIDDLFDGKLTEDAAMDAVVALSDAPITTELLVALATAMRMRMNRLDIPAEGAVDTCGTGGDGANTFNISTAVSLLCARYGVPVAKHGNVAATSISGSADVLQHLGVPIDLTNEDAAGYFAEHNYIFLFAKLYHPAMRHVAPIRQKLNRRTIFNLLGPLCNPAGVEHQVVGVSEATIAPVMADALIQLGAKHAIVVAGDDGLDEASITTSTAVYDYRADGTKKVFSIAPSTTFSLEDIQVHSIEESAEIITKALRGEVTPAVKEVLAMNMALALYAADAVASYEAGYTAASEFIDSLAA